MKYTIDGSERRVTKEHGQKMARELNAHHIEVSARTGHNIPQAFEVSHFYRVQINPTCQFSYFRE